MKAVRARIVTDIKPPSTIACHVYTPQRPSTFFPGPHGALALWASEGLQATTFGALYVCAATATGMPLLTLLRGAGMVAAGVGALMEAACWSVHTVLAVHARKA